MMQKRAQAALEFLMTYGWAILVVLVVIGALSYFGVLNPSILLPEKCTMQIGMDCTDYLIDGDTGEIKMKFTNGRGRDVYISHINITQKTGSEIGDWCAYVSPTTAGFTLKNGYANTFTLACYKTGTAGALTSFDETDQKVKVDIQVTYWNQGSSAIMNHTMGGELLANMENS